MPGAVADLTNTLGWTVMNYYAPYWVRYDSPQLSNPPKKEKRESFLEKFPTCNRAPGWSKFWFWVLWGHTSPEPFATPLVWFIKIPRPNLFENKVPFFYPGPLKFDPQVFGFAKKNYAEFTYGLCSPHDCPCPFVGSNWHRPRSFTVSLTRT